MEPQLRKDVKRTNKQLWLKASTKVNKNDKMCTNAPPPNCLTLKTTEEIPPNLIINYVSKYDFILSLQQV